MATYEQVADKVKHLADGLSGGPDQLEDMLRLRMPLVVDFYTAAGTDGSFTVKIPMNVTINSAVLVPSVAVADDNTNYMTLSVGSDDGAGGTWTELEAVDTDAADGSEDWVAGTAQALSSVTGAITAGTYLGCTVTHSGSGVLVSGKIVFDLELT